MEYTIGFSTGVFYKEKDILESIEFLNTLPGNAIELNFLKKEELFKTIQKITPDMLEKFTYISLYAPKYSYGNDELTRDIFREIQKFQKINQMHLDAIVIHPNTIWDFKVLEKYSLPLAFENLDAREESGIYRTPQGLSQLKKQFPSVRFVIDVNHIYTIDPTMKLAQKFYDALDDNIAQYHLSGCENKYHAPLYKNKQKEIIKAMKNPDIIPIIIESVLRPNEALKEYEYILANL